MSDVDACRSLFAGHPGDPVVWKALLIITALAVATAAFARSIR